MDLLDPLGVGVHQHVAQVHQRLAVRSVAPVGVGRVVAVQAGAHRAVEDQDAVAGDLQERGVAGHRAASTVGTGETVDVIDNRDAPLEMLCQVGRFGVG